MPPSSKITRSYWSSLRRKHSQACPLRTREQIKSSHQWASYTQAWSCASSHSVNKHLLNTKMPVWCPLSSLQKSWILLFCLYLCWVYFIYPRPCVHQANTPSLLYAFPEQHRTIHLYCTCLLCLSPQLLDIQMKLILQLAESWIQLEINASFHTKKNNCFKWTHIGTPRPRQTMFVMMGQSYNRHKPILPFWQNT